MPPSVACRQTDGAMMCYNARMKPIATNIADFETLRKEGLLYVDKTAHLHRLITKPGSTFFFCARPRRFGKSLSVTTLKSIFLGHREYFDGLAIAKTGYDWRPHAVIHFNWGGVEVSDIETFERTLAIAVGDALRAAGYPYDPAIPPSSNLARAIDFFYKKDGVGPAILIDEYDDPVVKALADVDLAERIRTRLSAIYAQFKDNSGKIRFLYITGVSKFTKLSVFSTLSSLNDISFEADYAALYGYTEEELSANFEGHMRVKAERMGLTYEAFRAELKRWFNGYRFADENPVTVYNPVSIALTLVSTSARFKPTWTSTGRASTLMNYIRREGALSIDPDRETFAGEADFDVADLAHIQPVGLLYQTGYLTIADYSYGLYTLRVPDEEVRQDLAALLAGAYAGKDAQWSASLGVKLRASQFDAFFDGLKSLYAQLPYGSHEGFERKNEFSYTRPLCMLLAAQGFRYDPEVTQTAGRGDLVATHPCGVYIFELKVDATAADALAQIREKGYAEPYRARGLPITAIGLAFDSKTRQLVDAAVERIQ